MSARTSGVELRKIADDYLANPNLSCLNAELIAEQLMIDEGLLEDKVGIDELTEILIGRGVPRHQSWERKRIERRLHPTARKRRAWGEEGHEEQQP